MEMNYADAHSETDLDTVLEGWCRGCRFDGPRFTGLSRRTPHLREPFGPVFVPQAVYMVTASRGRAERYADALVSTKPPRHSLGAVMDEVDDIQCRLGRGVDTNGDGEADWAFHDVIAEADGIVADPDASEAELERAKDLAEAIHTDDSR